MNDDLISRQEVLDFIDSMPCEVTKDGRYMIRRIRLTEYISDTLPSAQTSLIEAVKIIEDFLHGCHDSLTSEIVTPDGIKLHTDWGYFEEGLEEIKRYAERRA